MAHLDEERWKALLSEPTAHRELVEHLAQGCALCDAFLESSGPDLLDGITDALLLQVTGPRKAQLDEVGWRRLERAQKRPRRVVAVSALAGLLAASIAAVVLWPPPADESGLKAHTARWVLELTAAAQSPDGTVRRITDEARVRPDDVLVFRVHASEAGVATLWLQTEGGEPRRLGEVPLQAGTHDLHLGGELAGLSLAGESGVVTVWVVASRAPTSLDPAEALRRVNSGASRDVAVGRLVLRVEP